MAAIKNVALVGATGALGEPVLHALIKSGKFNVTVLARPGSKATFPASVKVSIVDYSNVASLTETFRGIDAVVSTVGAPGIQSQTAFIDAAIAAGVKRFLPSEFGSDLSNPKTAQLPIFRFKINISKFLEEKTAANPDFTYTLVRNSAFLDWGLQYDFILDLKSGRPRIFDGGDQLFSTTTLQSVGQAIVGVLEHPQETKNRAVYIQDMVTSQNKLLAIAKKIAPEKTKSWEPVPISTLTIKAAADAALAKGEVTLPALYQYLYCALFGEGYGGKMDKLDNDLLGIAGDKTDADIEAIMRPLLE